MVATGRTQTIIIKKSSKHICNNDDINKKHVHNIRDAMSLSDINHLLIFTSTITIVREDQGRGGKRHRVVTETGNNETMK